MANVGDQSPAGTLRNRTAPTDCIDGSAVLAPVDSFWPNAWGFNDMLGNAWELARIDESQSIWWEGLSGDSRATSAKAWRRELSWAETPKGFYAGSNVTDRNPDIGLRLARSADR